jgi:iron complex transport system substrate-binding protein
MVGALLTGCASTSATSAPEPSSAQTQASAVESAASGEAAAATQEQPTTVSSEGKPATRTIVDHNGDTVVIPAEINRVAVTTIYPLPSVLCMYLKSAEKIVGIHSVSMAAAKNGILGKLYPGLLNASTAYMQGDALNIEELIKLKPDVVFYSAPAQAEKEALQKAGIPAIGVHATKWKFDVIETFDQWIDLLEQVFPGQGDVAGVSDYSRQMLETVQNRVKDIPEKERKRAMFLFQYDDKAMITSGKNFFGQYWISAAGGINVAGSMEEVAANAIINIEQVYEWNPEIIYITNFTPTQPQDLYENKIAGHNWSSVTAVQKKQVYKMPLGAYRTYTPGVDTPLTLLWVAKTMYPQKFEDIDMTQQVKDYYGKFFNVTLTDDDVQAMFNPSKDAGVSSFMKK